MGMSSYIMDLEDKFQYTDIPKIISQSETVEEAIKKADEHRKKEFDFISGVGLDEIVTEQLNEFCSKYN